MRALRKQSVIRCLSAAVTLFASAFAQDGQNTWQKTEPSTSGYNSRQGGAEYIYGYPGCGTCETETGVVAQFLLDEASGNIADEVSAITLTANGTPTYSQSEGGLWTNLDPFIDFDATTDYFLASGAEASMAVGTDDFVIEVVGRYEGGANRSPWGDAQPGTEKGWHVQWNSSTSIRFALAADDATFTQTAFTTVETTNIVTKLRFTVDRDGNVELFVNGESQGTGSVSTIDGKTVSSYGPCVGCGLSNGTKQFNGDIWETRLTVGNLTNCSESGGDC